MWGRESSSNGRQRDRHTSRVLRYLARNEISAPTETVKALIRGCAARDSNPEPAD